MYSSSHSNLGPAISSVCRRNDCLQVTQQSRDNRGRTFKYRTLPDILLRPRLGYTLIRSVLHQRLILSPCSSQTLARQRKSRPTQSLRPSTYSYALQLSSMANIQKAIGLISLHWLGHCIRSLTTTHPRSSKDLQTSFVHKDVTIKIFVEVNHILRFLEIDIRS